MSRRRADRVAVQLAGEVVLDDRADPGDDLLPVERGERLDPRHVAGRGGAEQCEPARFARGSALAEPMLRASGDITASPMNAATIAAALGDTEAARSTVSNRGAISGSSQSPR